MAKARTPRATSSPNNKQVITMPDAGASVSLRKPGNPTAPTPMDVEAQIRQRAYEIYQERGCTPGQENEDWLRAEREVLARQNRAKSVSA